MLHRQKPAHLPGPSLTKFGLVINHEAPGLTFPPVLAIADEVIEYVLAAAHVAESNPGTRSFCRAWEWSSRITQIFRAPCLPSWDVMRDCQIALTRTWFFLNFTYEG